MNLPLKDIFNQQQMSDKELEEKELQSYICFSSQQQNFYVGINSVKEVLDCVYVAPYPVPFHHHVGIMNLRGKVVPVLTINHVTSDALDEFNKLESKGRDRVIVLESTDQSLFCLIVSDVFKLKTEETSNVTLKINDRPYKEFRVDQFIQLSQQIAS